MIVLKMILKMILKMMIVLKLQITLDQDNTRKRANIFTIRLRAQNFYEVIVSLHRN